MKKELTPLPRTEKKDSLAFLGMFKKPVLSMLIGQLKKENIKYIILTYDDTKTGEEAFTAAFIKAGEQTEEQKQLKAYELENRQLKHKLLLRSGK
jgi:hypothetical protein